MAEFFRNVLDGIIKLVLSVQWYDILDIALVAVAFYYLVKLLRRTRAFHLVKGIVWMGIIYIIVSALGMTASSYLFSHLFGDIVIVMLLLFQPEIRQAIETFGRGDFRRFSFFSRSGDFTSDELRETVSNISKAVSNMSDKKIGALIVLEGNTALNDIIRSGSTVDASITSTVIENIFFPKAPLHDGAMLIRDNRITCAGCVLPLSQADISKDLGTRHRAALGMSEHSDALIIVVSEETGYISIAKAGTLKRKLTLGELLEEISEFLAVDDADNDKASKWRRRKK